MKHIGIIGARKFRNKKIIHDFIRTLSQDSIIVTGACKGVCSWTIEEANKNNIEVLIYEPDLTNTISYFEVAERYYKRNRELINKCDFVHAFFSESSGFKGGTKYEVEYAIKLGKPVKIYTESKFLEIIYQPNLFHSNMTSPDTEWKTFFVKAIC